MTGCVALTLGRYDDEAIGTRRRGEDRRSAECDGLDTVVDNPDSTIVHPANRRNDLAGNLTLAGAVRPVGQAPTAQANGATGEEIVGAQTGNGIAWQQKDKGLADPTDACGARWTHGHAVNGQLTKLRYQLRCVVLAPDAGAPRHENCVGARSAKRIADCIRFVPESVLRFDHGAIARDETAKHVRIRIVDLVLTLW
jgi:hypothetical protein